MNQPARIDWTRYPVPSADNIFSANVPVMLNYNGPSTDCSAWTHALISMDNPDSNAIISANLSWTGYTSTLENLTSDGFIIGPQQFVSYSIPIKGRTVALNYSVISGVQALGTRYGIAGMSHRLTKYDAAVNKQVLVNNSAAYAINQMRSFFPNFWYEGRVLVTATSDQAGPASCAINYWDLTTNSYLSLGNLQVAHVSSSDPVVMNFLPAPIRVDIGNGTTAQNIQIIITPFPD